MNAAPPLYVALDFETADYGADSACALGMAKVEKGQVVDTYYRLIRPPRKKVMFTWVHGITWEQVKNSPDFITIWPEVAAFLQGASYLVAHNAPFDRRVLAGCCKAVGVAVPSLPFLCTLKGARRALQLPSNKLDAVCRHCGISLQHHHAGSDALAAAHILLYLHAHGLRDDAMLSGSTSDKNRKTSCTKI